MRFIATIIFVVSLASAAFAAEEGARPAIVDILTARLVSAATIEEAVELAEALRDVYGESDSASASVLYTQALVVAAEGDSRSTLYKLDRTIDLDEELVAAYVLRGEVRLEAGSVDGAFEDAMAAVERAPDYFAGLGLLANTFEARGHYASALATTREALKYNPMSAELVEQLERHEALAAGVGL